MNIFLSRKIKFCTTNKFYLSILIIFSVFSFSSNVLAAGILDVNPSTNLNSEQTINVLAQGLANSAVGSILECNNSPNQPTITVAGNQVPVSCTNPLAALETVSSTGTLPSTSFEVHTGTVGPPATGTDSNGVDATTDAAKFPCPPTAAQIAAGDSCDITFGDNGGDDVITDITFAGQAAPSTTPSTTTNTPSPSSSTSTKSTPLSNTGPGNTVLIFLVIAFASGLIRHSYITFRKNKISN